MADIAPEQLKQHVRHHYAVWRQAAERVCALDLNLGDSARERRAAVKRLETVPGVGPIVGARRNEIWGVDDPEWTAGGIAQRDRLERKTGIRATVQRASASARLKGALAGNTRLLGPD